MSELERELLAALRSEPERWFRPLDLGGTSHSGHSKALLRLCNKGLVEKRNRCASGVRGAYKYKLSKAGRDFSDVAL